MNQRPSREGAGATVLRLAVSEPTRGKSRLATAGSSRSPPPVSSGHATGGLRSHAGRRACWGEAAPCPSRSRSRKLSRKKHRVVSVKPPGVATTEELGATAATALDPPRRSSKPRERAGEDGVCRLEDRRRTNSRAPPNTTRRGTIGSLIPLSHPWLHRRDRPGA
jgi:hypothetical protein